MFHTPKPRQFHYQPRFYDPEKEKWESLKKKYSDEQKKATRYDAINVTGNVDDTDDGNKDLAYFEHRVREMDRKEHAKRARLNMNDLFRKREIPSFNYQPRFADNGGTEQLDSAPDLEGQEVMRRIRKHKIQRRFDIADEDYLKSLNGGKIVLYGIAATLLLLWVLL